MERGHEVMLYFRGIEDAGDYGRCELSLVSWLEEKGHPQNLHWQDALNSFRVTVEWRRKENSFCPFYYEAEYRDVHKVDLATAEQLVKVLRRVSRGLHKQVERLGHVHDAGDYAARIAGALGIKGVCVVTRTPNGLYSEGEYEVMEIGWFADHIRSLVDKDIKAYVDQAAA